MAYCEELNIGGTGSTQDEARDNFGLMFDRAYFTKFDDSVLSLVEKADRCEITEFPSTPYQDEKYIRYKGVTVDQKEIPLEKSDCIISATLVQNDDALPKKLLFKSSVYGDELHIFGKKEARHFAGFIADKLFESMNAPSQSVVVMRQGCSVDRRDFVGADVIVAPEGFLKSRFTEISDDKQKLVAKDTATGGVWEICLPDLVHEYINS